MHLSRTARETLNLAAPSIKACWGVLAGIAGFGSLASITVSNLPEPIGGNENYFYIALIVIGVVLTTIEIIQKARELRAPFMKVQIDEMRHFYIMNNGFVENMVRVLDDSEEFGHRPVFATGIDRTCDLSISTHKGVLHHIANHLEKAYGIDLSIFQQEVNLAWEEQHPDKAASFEEKRGNFCDTIYLQIPLPLVDNIKRDKERVRFNADNQIEYGAGNPDQSATDVIEREDSAYLEYIQFDGRNGKSEEFKTIKGKLKQNPSRRYLRLLLVLNSCKNDNSRKYNDPELVEGPDSRDVILSIFKTAEDLKVDTLCLPAVGTNGMGFFYSTVVIEIINAYAHATHSNASPMNMVLSIRDNDIHRHGLTRPIILQLARSMLRYIGEKS